MKKFLKRFLQRYKGSTLDLRVESGKCVGEMVLAPILEEPDTRLLVVDVGARNGMMLLPECYARYAQLIAFEPNFTEYNKLEGGRTDASRLGFIPPAFSKETYHPFAIGDHDGARDFFVTIGPGACNSLGKTDSRITDHMYLNYPLTDARRSSTYEKVHTTIEETRQLDYRKLDTVLPPGVVCDFLKLDTEGTEVKCLVGARQLLEEQRILFIKTEFLTVPIWRNVPLLGAQITLLNDLGYRLLDFDANHAGYNRDVVDPNLAINRLPKYAGDAYFCIDPDRNEISPVLLQRLALISMVFEFNSFAVTLLRDAALLSAHEISQIEKAMRTGWPLRKIKDKYLSMPEKFGRYLYS